MTFIADIEIKQREGILDPEEDTIFRAIKHINENVSNVQLIKKFNIEIKADSKDNALKECTILVDDILANAIIHDYIINIQEKI